MNSAASIGAVLKKLNASMAGVGVKWQFISNCQEVLTNLWRFKLRKCAWYQLRAEIIRSKYIDFRSMNDEPFAVMLVNGARSFDPLL